VETPAPPGTEPDAAPASFAAGERLPSPPLVEARGLEKMVQIALRRAGGRLERIPQAENRESFAEHFCPGGK